MKLYIDLLKGLNYSKLVKKPVQVHGKNGKVFTRMQWVDPMDASTGHGVRHIRWDHEWNKAMEHGVDKHPRFHEALRDQGWSSHKDIDNVEWNHHPPISLPETEESAKLAHEYMHRDPPGVSYIGHYPDSSNLKPHMYSDEQMSAAYKAHLKMSTPKKVKNNIVLPENSIVTPQIHDQIRSIAMSKHNNQYEKLSEIGTVVTKNWDHIRSRIVKDIDSIGDKKVSKIQKHILDLINSKQGTTYSRICAHPHVLQTVLHYTVGDNLEKYRNRLVNANLTINTDLKNVKSIMESGYKGATIDSLHPIDKEIYEDVHKDAFGIGKNDDRPIFMALNPDGRKKGAALHFGSSALQISPEILPKCSANKWDLLIGVEPIPHIYDMDHLKDMMILKNYESDGNEMGSSNWHKSSAYDEPDVPFEVEYHGSIINPELITKLK